MKTRVYIIEGVCHFFLGMPTCLHVPFISMAVGSCGAVHQCFFSFFFCWSAPNGQSSEFDLKRFSAL